MIQDCSQKSGGSSLVGILAHDLSAKINEVVLNDTYNIEPICDDEGIGKPFPDDAAVGATEVDADDFYSIPAM